MPFMACDFNNVDYVKIGMRFMQVQILSLPHLFSQLKQKK